MFFSIACPHCQKTLKVRDELIGSNARCPHCRGTITVQRPSTPEEEAAATPSGASASTGFAPGGEQQKSEPVSPPVSQVLSVTASTDVNVGAYFLFGIAATVIFYLILWPFAGTPAQRPYLSEIHQ